MVYSPRDHMIWDFWFAPRRPGSNDPYHLFYLRAPRSIADPSHRHMLATIGHAVSDDLITWEAWPAAFLPGAPGSWDDRAIWTGSIFERQGLYHFFYTGLSHAENGRVQRIGIATSPDLETWTRHPANPVLRADPRWYAGVSEPPWDWESCRDPWVTRDETNDRYLMFYVASAIERPYDEAGVIGCASSTDLLTWRPMPPVTQPGDFGMLEVPQTLHFGNRFYMLFCTHRHSTARIARMGEISRWWGTHYLVADRLEGPYRLETEEPLVGDGQGTYYAGRVVDKREGDPRFMAWRQWDEAGRFSGELSNPAPLIIQGDGTLQVDQTALWPVSGEDA